jgi:RNA polymerase subunit RPABC4/transcription elongation factor Spt4
MTDKDKVDAAPIEKVCPYCLGQGVRFTILNNTRVCPYCQNKPLAQKEESNA